MLMLIPIEVSIEDLLEPEETGGRNGVIRSDAMTVRRLTSIALLLLQRPQIRIYRSCE
jgi:hypothetical protein